MLSENGLHSDLTSDMRVGVLADTTGERRLLELTGLVDADGALIAGTRIETDAGTLTADGSANYTIDFAAESPGLEVGVTCTRRRKTCPRWSISATRQASLSFSKRCGQAI